MIIRFVLPKFCLIEWNRDFWNKLLQKSGYWFWFTILEIFSVIGFSMRFNGKVNNERLVPPNKDLSRTWQCLSDTLLLSATPFHSFSVGGFNTINANIGSLSQVSSFGGCSIGKGNHKEDLNQINCNIMKVIQMCIMKISDKRKIIMKNIKDFLWIYERSLRTIPFRLLFLIENNIHFTKLTLGVVFNYAFLLCLYNIMPGLSSSLITCTLCHIKIIIFGFSFLQLFICSSIDTQSTPCVLYVLDILSPWFSLSSP